MSSTEMSALMVALEDARARTLALVGDLEGTQLLGPRLAIVNPPLWELGHVAWFQERWATRHLRQLPALRTDGDALYDSAAVAHDSRWDLPLPSFAATQDYARTILDQVCERLVRDDLTPDAAYFHELAILHEDMHGEAFAYTRQTLGYIRPALPIGATPAGDVAPIATGDAEIPGGRFQLGAVPSDEFVFDNEKWAHPILLNPFRISRTPVTNAEFAAFVAAGGYQRPDLWAPEGWAWRERVGATYPVYWRPTGRDHWEQRVYDTWLPLPDDHPIIHLSWYEADAYCRWAGRRLPSEAEWEAAAAGEPASGGTLSAVKRRYPWGDMPPTPAQANLDGLSGGTVAVQAFAGGDSAFGCRQMIGNVWEWTASDFTPYPGFVVDPYAEYSAPWFRTHKILRGGCWATRARLIRNTWRNFYIPDRRDVLAGFRTCALDG